MAHPQNGTGAALLLSSPNASVAMYKVNAFCARWARYLYKSNLDLVRARRKNRQSISKLSRRLSRPFARRTKKACARFFAVVNANKAKQARSMTRPSSNEDIAVSAPGIIECKVRISIETPC